MSREQLSSSVSKTELIPKPRPRAQSDPSPSMPVLEGKSKPPLRSNSAEEILKTTPPRNLTTQPEHDERTWGRRQLNLEQREYAVAERERKLKLRKEKLKSMKRDQEYQLNQERSQLQAWEDMLVMRKKNLFNKEFEFKNAARATVAESRTTMAQLADREYAVQQREQKLEKKKQSLKLSAHKIGHDKTAIKRRWDVLWQREAELEKRSRALQARFQYSSDVPSLQFQWTASPQLHPLGHLLDTSLPDSGVSSQETYVEGYVDMKVREELGEMGRRRESPLQSAIRKRLEEVDTKLAESVAATPHDRAPLDSEQISKAESNPVTTNDFGGGSGEETVKEALEERTTMVQDRQEQSEKDSKNTQQSTDRGSPPTTTEEALFRPISLSCLRGVDSVIDETEFVLTDEVRSYNWRDSGFKLHTPHGALPAEAVPCRINVKASLSGQFEFPENSKLVSPVYWISTPKNLRFSRPRTVDFQHCGTVEERDDSDLSFVVAKCTQPDLPYKFKFLDGGCFVPNSSYGSISVTHFSGLAIVSKQRKGCSYCARTYIANRGGDCWSIHFVIAKDLDVVLKAVDANFNSARRDVALRVVFKQSKISLDIPTEGRLINNGWKITPRTPPYISKKDADEFRLGQWIPSCELIVEWERSGQCPVRLRHHVPLIGAKDPSLFFNIAIDPEWKENKVNPLPLSQQTYQENAKQELCERYPGGLEDKPELRDLMNEVAAKIPDKWRQFGIELRLSTSELNTFSLASPGDALQCFSSVFTLWQNRMSREPYSWLTVVESLKAPAVGELKLVLELCIKLTKTC